MLDFPTKNGFLVAAAALLVTGCIIEDGSPDLGPCSIPPEDRLAYEFGEIGIGTCLASPSDLRVRPDPSNPDNHFVFVANSNARSNFSGSSVLSIDGASIEAAIAAELGDAPGPLELACSEVGLHELDAHALTMQKFVGRFDFDDDGLGLVTNRHTGGFEGDLTDAVFVLDASDPRDLKFSDAGPRQTGPYRWIRVGADPWSVRIDPATGRAWVLSVTPHTVAALDLVSDPIDFVDLHGERVVEEATFVDIDASGSAPDFTLVGVNDDLLEDEDVTVTFIGGITRLYYPAPDLASGTALFQADSANGIDFVELTGGPVLDPVGDWAAAGFGTAALRISADGLEGLITGYDAAGLASIGRLTTTDHALDWSTSSSAVLAPATFDAAGTSDPDFLLDETTYHAWWTAGAGLGDAIGHATGSALTSLSRSGDTTLTGGDDGAALEPSADGWDSISVHAPSVVLHADTDEFLMFYAGHADSLAGATDVPAELAIGLARSDDGTTWTRDALGAFGDSRVLVAGEAGSWDSDGVAAPSAFFADGRFQLWYQGFDGVQWRTGRATSIDGRTWVKDFRNPVMHGIVDADGLPQKAYALKASPGGYYHVDGTLTGSVGDVAFEGDLYSSPFSPVLFQVIGGQALGRGDEGALDEDGAGAPAAVGDGSVLYTGRSGNFRRLLAAEDLGAGLLRTGPVALTGFTGDAAGLSAETPTESLNGVAAALADDGTVVAGVHGSFGIALARGTLTGDDLALAAITPEPALTRGEAGTFDDTAVRSPDLVLDAVAGQWRMYYEGREGETGRIALATSSDEGLTWTREGVVLSTGAAGAWDDAIVGEPSVVFDGDSWHLWYLGSDGSRFRIGYASSDDGIAWNRYTEDDISVPVFEGGGLSFALDDAAHPSVTLLPDGEGFEMWFEGHTDGIGRIGRARSTDGITWTALSNPTTAGDQFTITTRKGDDDSSSAVELGDDRSNPEVVDGVPVHGAGASEMILSPDGHLGLVANKRAGYVIVIDLFDDSDTDTGFIDANYGGVEAVLAVPQAHGMVGLRDMEFDVDGRLWVLMAPMVNAGVADDTVRFGAEGLIELNWDLVTAEDRAEGEAFTEDTVRTFLPAARGIEEDQGYLTEVSVGPAAMKLSADGSRAYVVNFNDNSLYIMDLHAGARGAILAIVDGLDENPWEVELTPDGTRAYVANYYGVGEVPVQHSTIQVIDVDEDSPTFGRVLTRLTNVPRDDCGL